MKKILIISSILFLLVFNTYAQTPTIGLGENEIRIGIVDSIYSAILKENRPIWISIPRSAEDSQKKFPVLYVLDGRAHFYSTVGMLHQLSVSNGNTILPEMIVVAIPNVNRIRDLTPSQVSYLPNSGGAENFSDFLEKELVPYIDEKYPTTPYRTLIGHSWGGLFVLNTLIHHSEFFDNYVTIDPSIKWDHMNFFKEASQILKNERFDRKSLYLAVANRLPKGLDLSSVVNDTLKSSEHMRTILQFNQICSKSSGLNFDWRFYPNDNHNGVPFIAIYDALRSLFEWYNFDEEFLFQEGTDIGVQELMDTITMHFENISDHFGYTFLPPETTINRFGNIIMSEQQYDKASALYDLNVKNYPNSFRVYDAMGDCYRNLGKAEMAITFYEKSLEIEETENVQRKLNNLLQSK
ncbi:tetratricopeptide repeat protein [Labilibaculum sp. A4]|uniref:alpha/beta hydrolase-fold protein n=1 Tax=Labilibaculum euxinus TaxID=2686357 RepID=UPI000F6174AB|nr:alpha/beta hydrolase-fold protein [Labilibaculum euxinus]MDQ1772775.1 alpha/beta hydrolase-fold protein [Labilibaculum euxinus]MWN78268.1 tetratricopeptide repeat protein [Labilibaculum euxinus]